MAKSQSADFQASNHAPQDIQLQPGTLWPRTLAQTEYALGCGALQPLKTDCQMVEQEGIPFVIRILQNLERKAKAKQKRDKDFNPFLPYDDDLFVAGVTETHLCLLNKFNVVPHHLLIVTRAFEQQNSWLNYQDFFALALCMQQVDGLGFYNAGRIAGASQRHKHLQLVPFPIAPDLAAVPVEVAVQQAQFDVSKDESSIGQSPLLPFAHAIAPLTDPTTLSSAEAAGQLLTAYETLLQHLELISGSLDSNAIDPEATDTEMTDTEATENSSVIPAYNLLVTRTWMMIVPRSQESFESISVNSLGFAGTLLVRNADQLEQIKAAGPLNVISAVARPA